MVKKAAVPLVFGSERVKVVVFADRVLGQGVVRIKAPLSHSQNGGPQYGEPGPNTTPVHATFVGMTAFVRVVVSEVLATWFGQSE